MTPDGTAVIEGVDIDAEEPATESVHELDAVGTPPPLALVVFGASGDLASRKLLPAIAALAEHGALPDGFTVIGVARTAWSDTQFRQAALDAAPFAGPTWHQAVTRFRYVAGEYAEKPTFDRLKEVLAEADATMGTAGNRVYYLATIPSMFGAVARALAEHECNVPGPGGSFARIVVEKPFGRDLASAGTLDHDLHAAFDENQIFRIDHYLGKETVQNVLALRFGNAIFEPIWNRRYVDHIQITVAEELGVEHRGGFYETAGALRDIVQNHVMQVLALTLMEPPATVDALGIRDEKVKLLRAVMVPDVNEAVINSVRGQYTAGTVDGEPVPGYREEEGVDARSRTETFVAMRLAVDNWRWAGVPVFIRTGKRLRTRATEVVLQFHRVPHLAFGGRLTRDLRPNLLQLRIQPDEGICLLFGAKVPGEEFRLRSVAMDFSYAEAFPGTTGGGYERLLHDVMIGDATLFIRTDEVERAWQICDPFLEAWSQDGVPLSQYPAGTWGPKEADLLLARELRQWHQP
ncbi:MAG TPA: glucose-6-phosphate dehydrogenase [Acidimicrobiales bacterium]|nr:glucose-6-phosphate dehydrogenase [Acidimicrobiales bacterium]